MDFEGLCRCNKKLSNKKEEGKCRDDIRRSLGSFEGLQKSGQADQGVLLTKSDRGRGPGGS